VGGDLTVTGPGSVLHVTGAGGRCVVSVTGRVPRASGRGAELLARLASSGIAMDVTDPSGRLLARVGGGRPSLAGWLLAGSSAVRPTIRGLIAGARGRLPRRAK
jgi:hypothetical protein